MKLWRNLLALLAVFALVAACDDGEKKRKRFAETTFSNRVKPAMALLWAAPPVPIKVLTAASLAAWRIARGSIRRLHERK